MTEEGGGGRGATDRKGIEFLFARNSYDRDDYSFKA